MTPTPSVAGPAATSAITIAVVGDTASTPPTGGGGTGPDDERSRTGSNGGPLEAFVLPALLAGIPALIVLLIVASQVAGGAAWLPIVRRWLNGHALLQMPFRRRS